MKRLAKERLLLKYLLLFKETDTPLRKYKAINQRSTAHESRLHNSKIVTMTQSKLSCLPKLELEDLLSQDRFLTKREKFLANLTKNSSEV